MAWRTHLLTGLQSLTGARVALYLHLHAPLSQSERISDSLAVGFKDAREQALWAHYEATGAHRYDLFHRGLYTRTDDTARLVARRLSDMVAPGTRQRSRPCGDYVAACHLVRLVHHELSALQGRLLLLPGTEEDISRLPPRLREVLSGLAAGESEKQIAARLGLSPHTVNRHVQRIYRHYKVISRAQLLAALRTCGLPNRRRSVSGSSSAACTLP